MERTSELRKEEILKSEKVKTLEEAVAAQTVQIEDYTAQLDKMAHELDVQDDRASTFEAELIQLRGQLELKTKINEQLVAN